MDANLNLIIKILKGQNAIVTYKRDQLKQNYLNLFFLEIY